MDGGRRYEAGAQRMLFCDGRAAEFVDQWVEDGTCERLFELTGTWVFTGNQNGIVRWMEKYEKESLEKADGCFT